MEQTIEISKRLYSIDETAKIFGVSRSSVLREIDAGKIPVRRIGNLVKIPADFVEHMIKWKPDAN